MGLTVEEARNVDAAVLRIMARRQQAVVSICRQLGLPSERTEAERILSIKAAALPPERCGPEIPAAPARGPMVAFAPMGMRRSEDGYTLAHAGFRGRDAARAADAFDLMARQAQRRGGALPFTPAQIHAGRVYAALVERHSSVGLKGVSVETMMSGRGGGGGEGFMDAVLAEGEAIERMRAAIGEGWALEITRKSRRKRLPLRLRELVDRVCLEGLTISDVLEGCGWGVYGETVIWARKALADALDRMAGVTKGLDA